MFKIIQDDKSMVVELTVHNSRGFRLYHNIGCNILAYVLVDHLNRQLKERLQEIRRVAYSAGYKDAKSKSKKQEWFSGFF